LAGVVLAITLSGIGEGVAEAQEPIFPHHQFGGLVNGRSNGGVVHTACSGPAEQGRVAKGQTLELRGTGHGNTGSSNSVYAWFVPSSRGRMPPTIEFDTIFRAATVSTSWKVPCTGKGEVEFSSCGYGKTCSPGSVPAYVKVTFEDSAT
jgi:hypothetical protein